MRAWWAAMFLVTMVAVAACDGTRPVATALQPTPTADPLASPVASPSNAAQATLVPKPSPLSTPSPTQSSPATASPATEVERANLFWGMLAAPQCPGVPEYDSLREAFARANLVIRGHPTSVHVVPDEVIHYDVVTVAISEVLKGEPYSPIEGTIELITRGRGDTQARLVASMPSGDHVIFLMSQADFYDDPPDGLRYRYFLPTWHQSVFRNDDGAISIPNVRELRRVEGRDAYPLELQSTSYEHFVGRIRRLAGNGQGSTVPPALPVGGEPQAC